LDPSTKDLVFSATLGGGGTLGLVFAYGLTYFMILASIEGWGLNGFYFFRVDCSKIF
jgi:hypothetical protein